MSTQTDIISLGAVGVLGYIVLKKLGNFGSDALNTANTYIETTKEKIVETVDNTKQYIPGTTTPNDTARENYNQTVDDVARGVAVISGQDPAEVGKYRYNGGGGYTDTESGAFIPGMVTPPTSPILKTAAPAVAPVARYDYVNIVPGIPVPGSVPVSPVKTPFPSAVVDKYAVKSAVSQPAVVAPTIVKAAQGGYSAAKSTGTTKDSGKYATIKVKR